MTANSERAGTLQKVLYGVFALYVFAFAFDKVSTSISGRASQLSVIGGSIRTLVFWGYAALFLWTIYQLGPKSEVYRHQTSTLILICLIIMFGLQNYTSLDLKIGGDEKANEYGKWESNMFWVYFLFLGALFINFSLYSKTGVTLTMSSVAAVIVLIYLTYVSVAVKNTRTLNELYLSEYAFEIPTTALFCLVGTFFAIATTKNLFVLTDQDKINDLIKTFLLFVPAIFIAYQMGTCVSDTRHQQKMLTVTKLQNLSKILDTSWQYHDISEQYISDTIDFLVSTSGSPLSSNDIHTRLMVRSRDDVTNWGFKPELAPLDLWTEIEKYIKGGKYKKFNIGSFLSPNRKNENPTKASLAFSPINAGILMLFITSLIVIGWSGGVWYTGLYKGLSVVSCILLAVGVGVIAYLGYATRTVSHNIDSRNEVYCLQYNMNPDQCLRARPQFEQTVFFLLDRVTLIKAGTGPVVVNNTNIFGANASLSNDPNQNANMRTIYSTLTQYSTGQPIKVTVDAYITAYRNLVTYATEVNIKQIENISSVMIYSGSDDIAFGDTKINSLTLADIYTLLTDDDAFARSSGLNPYLSRGDLPFDTDNEFFGLHPDPQTNAVKLFFTYEKRGSDFKDALLTVLKTKHLFRDLVYAENPDYSTTMNPRRAVILYSGNFDIMNKAARYLNFLKDFFKSQLQANFMAGDMSDTSSETWKKLTEKAASWDEFKISITGTQFDLITKITSSDLSVDDKAILSDVLMHAIKPQNTGYDRVVNDYLNKLFWIAKLESIHDNSQVTKDVAKIESGFMTPAAILLLLIAILLCIFVFLKMNLKLDTDDHFSDYFKTSVAGSKYSAQHNPLFILIILIILCYNTYNFFNLYKLESRAVGSVLFTNSPMWGGKISVIPLVVSLCSVLMFLPLYYSNFVDRGSVFFVISVVTSALCSPLVYFSNSHESRLNIRKFNSISLLVVFCLTFFLLISQRGGGIKNSFLRISCFVITIGIALGFTSIPSILFEVFIPELSDEELQERLKRTNIGVFFALILGFILYFIYFVMMKKTPLFSNKINRLDLPKSMSLS